MTREGKGRNGENERVKKNKQKNKHSDKNGRKNNTKWRKVKKKIEN